MALLREVKEFLGGCALIAIAACMLLRPGHVPDSPDTPLPRETESGGERKKQSCRHPAHTDIVNGGGRDRDTRQHTTPPSRIQDNADTSGRTDAAADSSITVNDRRTFNTVVADQRGSRTPNPARVSRRYAAGNDGRARVWFGDGLHKFWSRRYQDAIGRFQAARKVDPTNPAYVYFLALAYKRSGHEDLAKTALAEAVELEAGYRVSNWGKMMERVQGKERVWLEDARMKATVKKYVAIQTSRRSAEAGPSARPGYSFNRQQRTAYSPPLEEMAVHRHSDAGER